MATFKTYLLSKGYSNNTAESYNRGLLQYIVWADTQNIASDQSTYNELISYIQHLKNKGLQQHSIQQTINSLNHYFKWLIQLQQRTDNPTVNITIKGIKKRKLHHILSKAELEKLYNDYSNIKSDSLAKKRNKIILSLLVYQGLNSTELGRLTTADLKLREGKLFISRTRKSNERTLTLESHQILDMMEYQLTTRTEILTITSKQTDLLFTSLGKSINFNSIISKLLPQLKKINKKITSIHQIRTSVIVQWLKQYNLREVQYMAGHRYVSSTEAYLVNDLDDLQDEIEKYHPIH